eukprot:GFYU01003742.1.p1 GENE.GFYU01003742.1~~GFYU01003742.1.p1  ORF type:complete len:182 (+),score=42.07 GFYU01003742.1:84-548(+)
MSLENPNPTIFSGVNVVRKDIHNEWDEDTADPWDALEVYDIIKDIKDPEHPLTLEQLNVAQLDNIEVDDADNSMIVRFTPTIPHCTMATLIGLCLRVKLLRSIPPRFKVEVIITPGTHSSEAGINKQLADKERIQAALENPSLCEVVEGCLQGV